jgi:hypothetical protein
MHARLKQPLRTDRIQPATVNAAQSAAARRMAWLAGAFGFCCMMPYIAIPVGNRSAIQVGNLLTFLLVLPVLTISWRNRPFWMFPALMVGLCLSTLKVTMTEGDPAISFKTLILWAVSLMAMLPTQLYFAQYSLEILCGIAIAAIVHTAMGIWQWHAFSAGYFPLQALFENQSFLSVKENAEIIAKYTQRPFGVFPEPSAMSASLAPWALFWVAEMFGLVRLYRAPAKWQRILFGAAAIGSLGLIIISRSGHSMITLAVAVVMAVVWFVRCKATLRSFLAIVSVCWVALPLILVVAAIALSDRLGGGKMGNSSWEDRSDSLVIGLKLLTEGGLLTLIFGVGVGQTAPILQSAYRLEAVWSVTLVYLYETGLVGLIVMCAIGRHLARMWKGVSYDFVFAGILIVWLVGVTITTSYQQLLSLWLTLGCFTVWPSFCTPAQRMRVEAPRVRVLREPATRRRRRWSDGCTVQEAAQ